MSASEFGESPRKLSRKSVIKHTLFHMWRLFVFKYFVSGAKTRTSTNIRNKYNIYQKVDAGKTSPKCHGALKRKHNIT